jgi:hypothetical protein
MFTPSDSKSVQEDFFGISKKRDLRGGAGRRIRTDDLLITNQLLYQLSYAGIYEGKPSILIHFFGHCIPLLYPSDKNGHNVRTPFRCRCALSAFPPKRQAHSSGWHVCAP